MARRKKEEKIDPFERARIKKLRSAQRREERKRRRAEGGDNPSPRRKRDEPSDYSKPMIKDDYAWVRSGLIKSFADRVLNHFKERPYWLSISHALGDGNIPLVQYYPCTTFRTKDRTYYGFLFREHRDLSIGLLNDARKELTETIGIIAPHLI